MNVEKRSPEQLRPHPDQEKIWGDLPSKQFQRLVNSIRNEGLRDPIYIDSRDCIIDGHQRWRAAKDLEIKEIPVRVVDNEATAENLFLTANITRRQLGPIQQARAIEAIAKRKQAALPGSQRRDGELREEIGRMLDMTGRTVGRLIQLLRLPVIIQNSVDRGHLPQSLALKLERMPKSVQDSVAERIEFGVDARVATTKAIEEYAKRRRSTRQPESDPLLAEYQDLITGLETIVPKLDAHVDDIVGKSKSQMPICKLLDSAIEILGSIRAREDELISERQASLIKATQDF